MNKKMVVAKISIGFYLTGYIDLNWKLKKKLLKQSFNDKAKTELILFLMSGDKNQNYFSTFLRQIFWLKTLDSM